MYKIRFYLNFSEEIMDKTENSLKLSYSDQMPNQKKTNVNYFF